MKTYRTKAIDRPVTCPADRADPRCGACGEDCATTETSIEVFSDDNDNVVAAAWTCPPCGAWVQC